MGTTDLGIQYPSPGDTHPSAAWWQTLASTTTAAIKAAASSSLSIIVLAGPGIDPTGATDSTSALQAAINANPGRRLFLPAGVYAISSLSLTKGQHLIGAGQQDWRDRFSTFGTPGWMVNGNFTGTVIRSNIATGAALTLKDAEVNSGGFEDFTLIGPGTGNSAVGILIGDNTWTVVNGLVRNVKIGNFPYGMRLNLANECSFYDLMIRGCTIGIDLAYATNQNAFYMLDLQWCGDGMHISADSYCNGFYSMIAQSCSDFGVTVFGSKNAFYNPYFENNGGYAMDFRSGAMGNLVSAPFLNSSSGDKLRIQAGANDNSVTSVGWNGGGATVVNAGDRSYIQGRIPNLTNTGANAVIIDPGAPGTPYGVPLAYTPTVTGITAGNGTTVGRYTLAGKVCTGSITFTVGSTSTMVGLPSFTLPYSPAVATGGRAAEVEFFNSGDNYYRGFAVLTAGGAAVAGIPGASGVMTALTASTPFAWSAGDVIAINFTYEVA